MVYILGMTAAVALICLYLQRRAQRQMLERIRSMIGAARNGDFAAENMDESLLSAVENDMAQFLQEALVSRENLQEQKEEIQTLISDISHQTTTPLSNIMIYSQLLEELLAGADGFEQASIVRSQAEKLDFLIKSLVKTSRLETGIIETVVKPCDLCRLAASAVSQAEHKAVDKGVALELILPEEPVFARCNPKWTAEACFNILDNAVKYTEPGGRVELSITAYSLFARIDVRDTGMGISEEEIPKIFGRFYRSQEAAAKEGVGLGLFLARRIAEAEGGYIKVSSKPGEGSCFSLFLPECRESVNLSEV